MDCTADNGQSLGSSSPTTVRGVGGGRQTFAVVVSNGPFCNVEYASTVAFETPGGTADPSVGLTSRTGNQPNATITASRYPTDHYQLELGNGAVVDLQRVRPGPASG